MPERSGAHAASKASSGFSRHSASAIRVIGARGSGSRRGPCGLGIRTSTGGKGGRPFNPCIAETLLR